MTRHGLRVGPAYPWAIQNVTGKYAGDVWQCSRLETAEDYEKFRQQMGDPSAFKVVQIDDNGKAIQ